MKVAIIDYGSGNLASAEKAFERAAKERGIKAEILVTSKPEDVLRANRIVLPGVGAFADCKRGLDALGGMVEALTEAVENKGTPFFGICVGQQLMATRGLEKQVTDGLGWIEGDVKLLEPSNPSLKIPHMGWNTLNVHQDHPWLSGIPTGPDGLHAYFVHSYHMVPKDKAVILAEADYGGCVTAIVFKDNKIGTQFHPEKSQTLGLSLIANFLSKEL